MGQKIHPLGLRIGITQQHRSRWFAKPHLYAALIQEDRQIRTYLQQRFKNAGVARIHLIRKSDRLDVEILTARPGTILGQKGALLKQLREDLAAQIKCASQVAVHVIELEEPDLEATLIADLVAEQLEKRTAFRRAIRDGMQRAKRAGARGIKIQVSGRLNGAEIARSEWVRDGRVPLHTLRADIDYVHRTAKTIYGILGIKVWIFRGEVLAPRPISQGKTFSVNPPKQRG